MKSYITTILIACILLSCSEDEDTSLSGRYNFIEPPHPISRINRLDNSQIAFDVIFTIQGNSLSEVDMVVNAEQALDASGEISGRDIIFQGGGGLITIHSVRKVGNTIQASGAEFTLSGQTKTYGALQIDRY